MCTPSSGGSSQSKIFGSGARRRIDRGRMSVREQYGCCTWRSTALHETDCPALEQPIQHFGAFPADCTPRFLAVTSTEGTSNRLVIACRNQNLHELDFAIAVRHDRPIPHLSLSHRLELGRLEFAHPASHDLGQLGVLLSHFWRGRLDFTAVEELSERSGTDRHSDFDPLYPRHAFSKFGGWSRARGVVKRKCRRCPNQKIAQFHHVRRTVLEVKNGAILPNLGGLDPTVKSTLRRRHDGHKPIITRDQ